MYARLPFQGFTLIELLIVVSMIALLTFLAYPSYSDHLIHVRRSDGQMALIEQANLLENYYFEHHTYSGASIDESHWESPEKWYRLSFLSLDDQNYVLKAEPQKAQAHDKKCQSLTLNQLGEKGISHGPVGEPQGSIEDCW